MNGGTGQVVLRVPCAADGPALIAANACNRDFHWPWATPPADEAAYAAWLAESGNGRTEARIAWDAETGAIIGVVTLSEIVRRALCSAYLGFYGMRAFAGRGLMTEAVGGVVRIAFEELGLHRVEANVQPDNARSLALIGRLGFQREGFSPRYLRIGGVWRDHVRFALLADEGISSKNSHSPPIF